MRTIGVTVISHNSYQDLVNYFNSFAEVNDTINIEFLILETSECRKVEELYKYIPNQINYKLFYIPNKGYAYACNYGLNYFKEFDLQILSNADIIFPCDIITGIRQKFDSSKYGTVLQKNTKNKVITFDLYPQYKNIFTEVFKVHRLLNRFIYYNPKYTYIVGAYMIFGSNVIKQNGTFDENYFLYFEETDYYYRLRKNNSFIIIKDKYITHKVSSSISNSYYKNKLNLSYNSLKYYCQKYQCESYIKHWKLNNNITKLYSNIFR